MSKIALQSNSSGTGTFSIASPNSNTDRTLTLPDASGTIQLSGNALSGTTGSFSGSVGIGGATPAASGSGISFPATQSASSDANTLDDYEEGTWTPVIDSSTAGTGRVTTVNSARYTKIGNLVTFHCYITVNTLGTGGSGLWVINGLPYTSSASDHYGSLPVPYCINLNGNLVSIGAFVLTNSTQIRLTGQAAAGTAFNTLTFATYVKASTELMVGGSYYTT